MEIYGADHIFHGVEVSTSGAALSGASLYVNAWMLAATNCMLTSCVGEISDRGWYITGDSNRFSNCRGDLNFAHDWEITGSNNLFSACFARGGGRATANTYDGWKISGTGNQFAACRADHPTASGYRYCFEDGANYSQTSLRNQYAACDGSGFGTALWKVENFLGSTPTVPINPTRPSSGTTFDVTQSRMVVPQHASPTTVTNFVNGVSGQELYIIGNPNITLQNNSTIKTTTGADKVLTTNRVYQFVIYNGVWFEVGA